jgi:poly(3-hydroxybutyrate) depolymerase
MAVGGLGNFLLSMSLVLATGGAWAAAKLPAYNVDVKQSSVSGLSAGGFMAVQFHMAFSSVVRGVGVIAGGPYYCAQGKRFALWFYLSQCTRPFFWSPAPNAARLAAYAERFAHRGQIDALTHLAGARVYLFSGGKDYIVTRPVVNSTKAFYRHVGVTDANIRYETNPVAGHAMLTVDYGNACFATVAPFINDCDYDQAGAILQHIYGLLQAPAPSSRHGEVLAFSQAEFIHVPPKTLSMSETGYVYVPTACRGGDRCRIHIVFHGCQQASEAIGDRFYRHAGYNNWAGTNKIIVLYPQAIALVGRNPQGCWDWWGYHSADYYNKKAPQMAAVMAMVKRLAGEH